MPKDCLAERPLPLPSRTLAVACAWFRRNQITLVVAVEVGHCDRARHVSRPKDCMA